MITDVWHSLADSKKPIILYGMGNGADKILRVFESYGIKADGIFVSDEFVRDKYFHGMHLESYGTICDKFDDFTVCVAFASHLPEVIENVRRIATERETVIPEVPVVTGSELFNSEYYEKHKTEIKYARELFSDEESKRLFDSIIEYRLYGKPDMLFGNTVTPKDVFSAILSPGKYTSYVDAGAYTGDTIRELQVFGAKLKYTLALEPDRRSYKKLVENTNGIELFDARNVGAWSEKCTASLSDGLGRGTVFKESGKSDVEMTDIDFALDKRSVDYIKYDVEGCEKEAILGTRYTIENFAPDLCVSLYHRSEDIFTLPKMIAEMQEKYDLYLRRFYCMPAWDLNLYAVNKEKRKFSH